MKRLRTVWLLCLLFAVSAVFPASGQEIKLVTGRIVNITTGKPFDAENILIYTFNTHGEADDAYKVLSGEGGILWSSDMLSPDDNGYYETRLSQEGVIIVKVIGGKCAREDVNYRQVVDFNISGNEELPPVIKAEQRSEPEPDEIENTIDGNDWACRNIIKLPSQFGKTNARLILQPFLIDGSTGDTVRCLKPFVYDGEQYGLTQERRMGYDTLNDPLMRFVRPEPLVDSAMVIDWVDTIYLDNPAGNYSVQGGMRIEDYNKVYFEKEYRLASGRARRPLKFLEYTMDRYELDPMKYIERAQKQNMNTTGNISLTFLVNKAQLDASDPQNDIQLDKLKNDLLDIVHGEGSTLREFHITGISSPDGVYAKNLELARKRMKYAMSQITSVLPKYVRDRVYMPSHAEVAPWTAVADLLEADSLMAESADVRSIIEKYPDSHDAQGIRIRKLPYYKKVIGPYLTQLRTVKYEYKYDVLRELTPEEIMDKYRKGEKSFDLYEYWHLFQMVKDEDELEALYKRAYDESLEKNGKPWLLAANNLAVAYLKKGIVDTTILAPVIDTRSRTNVERRKADGTVEILNPAEAMCNQICMLLQSNNFRRASVLTKQLPKADDRYRKIIALTRCLGGYYKKERDVFNTVVESSPLNKVVMFLAMKEKRYDMLAEEAVKELPQDDALTLYLQGIINIRKYQHDPNDFMSATYEFNAVDFFNACFSKEPKYKAIAASDGDIPEELLEEIVGKDEISEE